LLQIKVINVVNFWGVKMLPGPRLLKKGGANALYCAIQTVLCVFKCFFV